jgi:Fe2+ or Zn2+ uptake regulation protein
VPTPSPLESALREAGLRVTRPRLAVLDAVHGHPHADTDALFGLVRSELGEVSQQAVYDVLRALTAARLVRRFEPMGSPARYEARVGDHHHHLVCRDCGDIVDVDHTAGDTTCLTPAAGSGYEVDETEVIFWGRCARCVAGSPGRATTEQRRLDRAEP